MKKFLFALLTSLLLSVNLVSAKTIKDDIVLTKGVYKVSDLEMPVNDMKYVENISKDNKIVFVLLNENLTTELVLRLEPNSTKYEIPKIYSDYRILILGDGSAIISK